MCTLSLSLALALHVALSCTRGCRGFSDSLQGNVLFARASSSSSLSFFFFSSSPPFLRERERKRERESESEREISSALLNVEDRGDAEPRKRSAPGELDFQLLYPSVNGE